MHVIKVQKERTTAGPPGPQDEFNQQLIRLKPTRQQLILMLHAEPVASAQQYTRTLQFAEGPASQPEVGGVGEGVQSPALSRELPVQLPQAAGPLRGWNAIRVRWPGCTSRRDLQMMRSE